MSKVYELLPEDGARRLDFLMTDKKITAVALSVAADHRHHTYVARMRRGHPEATRIKEQGAVAISRMLGCQVDYLFREVRGRTQRTTSSSRTSNATAREPREKVA